MDRKSKTDPSRQRPYSAVRKPPIDIKFTNQELQGAFDTQRSQYKSFNTTKRSETKPTKPPTANPDKPTGEQPRQQKYVFESNTPLYRFAQPYSNKGQSSNRFWAENNDSNPVLGVNSLNCAKGRYISAPLDLKFTLYYVVNHAAHTQRVLVPDSPSTEEVYSHNEISNAVHR